MTRGSRAQSANEDLPELSRRLAAMLDGDPAEVVRMAREIDVTASNRLSAISVRATFLVDGGTEARDGDAIEEGISLFRELHAARPSAAVKYNLANALTAAVGEPPNNSAWLDHTDLFLQWVERERVSTR